jgi:hypothetical protein
MTIIMGYTVGIVPIVMGDILVTRAGASDSMFNKLAFGQMNEEAAAHVSMLRQKVNIINDDMILVWAGNLLQASAAFRHIAEAIERRPAAAEDIGAVIGAIPEGQRNDLSLIGLIQKSSGFTSFFWHNALQIPVEVCGNAVIAGTGIDYVARLVAELEHKRRCNPQDDESDELKAVLFAMLIAAEAAGLEHFSGANLVDRWGGAIEVASFERRRAKKLSDTLYAFWDFQTEAGGRLELIPKFVKVQYHKDLLVIFLLRGQGSSREELRFEVYVWGVPPLISPYQIGSVVHVPHPSFRYDYLCSQIALKTGTTVHRVNSLVLADKDSLAIRFFQDGQKTAVQVDRDYEIAIEEFAREMQSH